ncbi:MAG: hypothetical protein ACT4NV_17585 [Rhodoferax sp.]
MTEHQMEYWPILAALIPLEGGFAVARYNAYRVASAKFRSVVLDSLSDFYPTFTRWNGATFGHELRIKFPVLQSAVTDFCAALPWYQKGAFMKAWALYCNSTDRECDMNTYLHYFDAFDPSNDTQVEATARAKELFHANVARLLEFAHWTRRCRGSGA